jgi:hypothetical protein
MKDCKRKRFRYTEYILKQEASMSKITNKLRLSLALPIIGGAMVLAPVTVFAQQGSDDGSSSSPNKGRSSVRTVASSSETENESGDDSAADAQTKASIHAKASELLTTKRQNVKEHTAEQKKKSCEARAANIKKRADNYATAAQRHLNVFNKIFTRVQDFQTKKQLTVTNYDDLVAAATAKQTAAQAAVDALKDSDVTIDCTQADPASAVATLKTATANARTALHEYRVAIKDLVVALKGASTAKDGDDTSTTPTGDTTTTDTTTDTTGGTQ